MSRKCFEDYKGFVTSKLENKIIGCQTNSREMLAIDGKRKVEAL